MDNETRQLLGWYVNGTLTGTERDQVEAALRNEADATALLEWERAVQAAVKNDPALDVPADRGLYQTMRRIRAETTAKKAPQAAPEGWLARLWDRIQWSPAMALACGVIAVQFAVISQVWMTRSEESEFAGVRAMAMRPDAAGAFVRISFRAESTQGELNTLLRAINAEVVSGPSQLGDYYLLLEKPGAQNALNVLQNSAYVESAEFVNALPARP